MWTISKRYIFTILLKVNLAKCHNYVTRYVPLQIRISVLRRGRVYTIFV